MLNYKSHVTKVTDDKISDLNILFASFSIHILYKCIKNKKQAENIHLNDLTPILP